MSKAVLSENPLGISKYFIYLLYLVSISQVMAILYMRTHREECERGTVNMI